MTPRKLADQLPDEDLTEVCLAPDLIRKPYQTKRDEEMSELEAIAAKSLWSMAELARVMEQLPNILRELRWGMERDGRLTKKHSRKTP